MTQSKIDGRSVRYQHRKSELLDAATEYVLAHGLSDLSLRPLAQQLGISHASLLRHFSSKDELVMAVLERIRTDLSERLAVVLLTVRTASTVVRSWGPGPCGDGCANPGELGGQFLLLFELVGYGRSPEHQLDLATSVVKDWIDISVTDFINEGWTVRDVNHRRHAPTRSDSRAQARPAAHRRPPTGRQRGLEMALRTLSNPSSTGRRLDLVQCSVNPQRADWSVGRSREARGPALSRTGPFVAGG